MPIMTEAAAQPGKRAGTDPDSVPAPSARTVYHDLIRLELEALLAAISVLFMLEHSRIGWNRRKGIPEPGKV